MYYGYRAARNTADGVNFANFDRRKFPFWPYPLCTMFDALFTLKLHDAIETNDTRIRMKYYNFYYKIHPPPHLTRFVSICNFYSRNVQHNNR